MITKLTKEQEARFPEFIDKWIKIGLSTEPANKEKAEEAVRGLYRLTKLKEPKIIWCPCPISGAISAVVIARLLNHHSAVDSAVDSAVRSAVDSAVRSAVSSAVSSAVDSAVRSAVSSAVYSAVDDAVSSAGGSFWGGSLWPGYSSWADFFSVICNIKIDRNFLDMVENCGYYWVLDGLAILTDRPEAINRNAIGQLHSTNGMAIKYRSGWGLYSLNGVAVPEWLVNRKDTEIDPHELLKIDNAEVRREFVRKVGYDRIFYKLGGKVIDKKELFISNGTEMFKHIYEVVRLQTSGINWTALKMINPSLSTPDNQVYHIEGLPNNCDTVEKAINFRKPDKMKKIKLDNQNGEDYYQHGDVCVWPAGAKALKMYPTILA